MGVDGLISDAFDCLSDCVSDRSSNFLQFPSFLNGRPSNERLSDVRVVADDAKMADGGHRDSMHPRIGTLLRVADSGYGAVQGAYGRANVEGDDDLW